MSSAIAITERDFAYLITATAVSDRNMAMRDVALLYVLFLTGLMPSEIGNLKISDYRDASSISLVQSNVRAEIAFNGKERPLFWLNQKMINALDAYLATRSDIKSNDPLFLTAKGKEFSYRTTARNGTFFFSCASLTNLYNKLFNELGLQGVSTETARRTLATWLYQRGAKLNQIGDLLGLQNINTVKNLIKDARPPSFDVLLKNIV